MPLRRGNREYFDETQNREELFSYILEHLTHEVLQKSFLIEFRNLDNPLFGYKAFRKNKYFPINWLRVYNSLHSRTPLERLSVSRKRQINKALKNGAYIEVADNDKDITLFSKMLKKAYSSQVRKHFPDLNFFRLLTWQRPDKEMAKIFLVKYKDKIIGGSVCVFSNGYHHSRHRHESDTRARVGYRERDAAVAAVERVGERDIAVGREVHGIAQHFGDGFGYQHAGGVQVEFLACRDETDP